MDTATGHESHPHPIVGSVLINRALLTIGAVAAIALFYAAARQFHIPAQPGYSASLLQQPSAVVGLFVTGLTMIVATVLGSIIAGKVHRDAGLFCAAIGLAALSCRGGPMRFVLFDASGRSVYLLLAAETIALGAIVALAWAVLDQWPIGSRAAEPSAAGTDAEGKYITTLMHVLIMIALMSLLARTDSKAQVLAAVGISSLLASLGAHWFAPAGPSPWLWSSPFIVALVGYLACWFNPAGLEIGRTSGYFAALARPLPLDYASVGVAGALLGYWTSTKWHAAKSSLEDSNEP